MGRTNLLVLDVLGDLLTESGWTDALIQANIASAGKADSFLKAAHITCTRHAHQVTACGLYILLHLSYNEYSEANDQEDTHLDFSEWCIQKCEECPQFKFWYMILNLQLLMLVFVRSIREGNFSLTQVVKCFFRFGSY